MKTVILLTCILYCCSFALAQESESTQYVEDVDSYSVDLHTGARIDREVDNPGNGLRAVYTITRPEIASIRESKLACDFIIHPVLHSNRYLLVSYLGLGQASCFVTDESNKVLCTNPLNLSSARMWIDLNHLAPGGYFLNVKLDGVTYQEFFHRD